MSTLYLIIDSDEESDFKDVIPERETRKRSKGCFRFRLPWHKRSSLLTRQISRDVNKYSEARVAEILREFLQPNSDMSASRTAESILELLPDNAPEGREICSFSRLCVELAAKIPYHHPSQFKFVILLQMLGQSSKFMSKYILESKEVACMPLILLCDSICDIGCPNEEFPMSEWVNIIAFRAHLAASGIWGSSPGAAFAMLRAVFETKEMKKAADWERHAGIMAAAQWIIWYGQAMFKFIVYDGHCGEDKENDKFHKYSAIGDLLEGRTPDIQARSIERWRYWKTCFEAVEMAPGATAECKKLAARAARLMGALEENMIL